jgi:hypothetical protein
MADISDVCTHIASRIVAPAVYPNGQTQPAIIALPVRVMEGWPLGDQIDRDLAATPKVVNVSVFPVNVGAAAVSQVTEEPQVITPAVHGLSFVVSGVSVAVTGTPSAGEYLSLIVDGKYAYSRVGTTVSSILAALLADVQVNYPSATVAGNVITITGASSVVARSGAPATMGQVLHRQKADVMVTVWAPDPVTRSTLSAAIDVSVKQNLVITLPDTSQAIVTYARTMVSDAEQARGIYRRDIVFEVQYATLDTFIAYEVTSVPLTTDSGPPTAA